MGKMEFPNKLVARQEQARQEVYEKIEAAAQELKSRKITRKALMQVSGLALSTFSKQHVKAYLLKRWGIGVDQG